MRKPITINVISESVFTVQTHGVHSCFLENCDMLSRLQDVNLQVNAFGNSDLTHIHTVGPYALLHLFLVKARRL